MKKEYDFEKGKRGPIVAPGVGKSRITIRLDNEILDWFREQAHAAKGGSYQTMINDALQSYIRHKSENIESVVRRVLREEIRKGNPKPHARKVT